LISLCIQAWRWPPTVTADQPVGPVVRALIPLLKD